MFEVREYGFCWRPLMVKGLLLGEVIGNIIYAGFLGFACLKYEGLLARAASRSSTRNEDA